MMLCGISVVFNLLGEVFALVSYQRRSESRQLLMGFQSRKPLLTSSIPAAVQRSAIAALRQRFTLRQTLRTVLNFNVSISISIRERRCLENAFRWSSAIRLSTDAEWGVYSPLSHRPTRTHAIAR